MGKDLLLASLLPAITQMSWIMLAGYLASRCGAMTPPMVVGITRMLGLISLPAMVFLQLAALDLSTVQLSFVGAFLFSKLTLFCLVVAWTLFLGSSQKRSDRFIQAGLRGILSCQANDMAMGLPIALVLYEHTQPTFPLLLYVVQPVYFLVINPLAFFICELGVNMREKEEQEEGHNPSTAITDGQHNGGGGEEGAAAPSEDGEKNQQQPAAPPPGGGRRLSFVRILWEVAKDPLVFMTVAGVVWNLLSGARLPSVVSGMLRPFSELFPTLALFSLGVNMDGAVDLHHRGMSEELTGHLAIVTTKTLLLSVLAYYLTVALGGSQALAMFAFLVGAIPPAASLGVYALRYSSPTRDYVSEMSAAVVLTTVVGTPVLLVLVLGLGVVQASASDAWALIAETVLYLSLPGALASLWLLACLAYARARGKESGAVQGDLLAIVVIYTVRQWASVAVSYSPRPLLSSPSRLYGAEVLSLGLNCLLFLSVAVLAVTTWARAAVGQEPADRLRARLTAAAWVVSAAATVAGAFILGRSGHALSNQVLVEAPMSASRLSDVVLAVVLLSLLATATFTALSMGHHAHTTGSLQHRASLRLSRLVSSHLSFSPSSASSSYLGPTAEEEGGLPQVEEEAGQLQAKLEPRDAAAAVGAEEEELWTRELHIFLCSFSFRLIVALLRCLLVVESPSGGAGALLPFLDAVVGGLQPLVLAGLWGLDRHQPLLVDAAAVVRLLLQPLHGFEHKDVFQAGAYYPTTTADKRADDTFLGAGKLRWRRTGSVGGAAAVSDEHSPLLLRRAKSSSCSARPLHYDDRTAS